jgi:hypothetical protein
MSSEDGVDLLLRHAEVDSRFVGPAEVDRLAACVVDEGLRDELVSAVLETCDAVWEDGARFSPGEFAMRVGGWRLDLGRTAVRSGLMTSIVAGALVQQGLTQMVIGVVAAVIPSVLDIQRGPPCRRGSTARARAAAASRRPSRNAERGRALRAPARRHS